MLIIVGKFVTVLLDGRSVLSHPFDMAVTVVKLAKVTLLLEELIVVMPAVKTMLMGNVV